jgi:aryl-alcohol dehydrogenase-like predicted oxidoreductase
MRGLKESLVARVEIEYRFLGRTGVKVTPICLGTSHFGKVTPQGEATRMIHRAMDAGINFIDTADMYSLGESERIIGNCLSGGKRKAVVLASKFYFPLSSDPNERGTSRRHILTAVEHSLKRLQTEWIDLYQVHRPALNVPQEETLRALDDLVHQGKVRYIGTSTYPAWLVMEGLALSERHGWSRYVTEQSPYNLLDRRIENELVPMAQRHELGLLVYSPTATGILAGRYARADSYPPDSMGARHGRGSDLANRITERALAAARRIADAGRAYGVPHSQLAVLWAEEQPQVTSVIIGPRTMAQLNDSLAVLGMRLEPQLAAELDKICPPGSVVTDFFSDSTWMKMRVDF